eukprot:c33366_g1_i1 orf=266-466(+)
MDKSHQTQTSRQNPQKISTKSSKHSSPHMQGITFTIPWRIRPQSSSYPEPGEQGLTHNKTQSIEHS